MIRIALPYTYIKSLMHCQPTCCDFGSLLDDGNTYIQKLRTFSCIDL